ncbi:MAG: DEAD/DEAH box helicase [Deltaproteobacteria bacterium]|nr:DEAD/DEAH box helicase [Deltaproteobacteria bacterium]
MSRFTFLQGGGLPSSSSLLERLAEESSPPLTQTQQQIDTIVSGTAHQLSDWRQMSAMLVGGLGYQIGKTAFIKNVGPSFMKAFAPVVGLATEVSFFEGMNLLLWHHPSPQGEGECFSRVEFKPPSPWGEGRGEGSFSTRWLHSFINFGTLKSFGHLGQHHNVVVRHLLQSLGMVAGEQALSEMNLNPKIEGNFTEHFIRAEATNFQLGLSLSLAHHLMGNRFISTQSTIDLQSSHSFQVDHFIEKPKTFLLKNDQDFFPFTKSRFNPRNLKKIPYLGIGLMTLAYPKVAEASAQTFTLNTYHENIAFLGAIGMAISAVRLYQRLAIERVMVNKLDRGLVVLPTGTGKTITFAELISKFLKGAFSPPQGNNKRVLVIAHREEIVTQNAQKIAIGLGANAKAQIGIYQAGSFDLHGNRIHDLTSRQVVIASIQTLIRNEIDLSKFGLVILDEAHHYVPGNEWITPLIRLGFMNEEGKIIQNPERILVGFTATPDRLQGQPLKNTFGDNGLLFQRDISTMVQEGYLLEPYGIEVQLQVKDSKDLADSARKANPNDKAKVIGKIFQDILRHSDHYQRTMIFASNEEEVEIITQHLHSLGIKTLGVVHDTVWMRDHSQIKKVTGLAATKIRSQELQIYRNGGYDAFVNINIGTEGFDDPGTQAVLLARSTDSRSLLVQMIGRALRPDPKHPERQQTLIVDLGGNLRRHNVGAKIQELYAQDNEKLQRKNHSEHTTFNPSDAKEDIQGTHIHVLGSLIETQDTHFSKVLKNALRTPEDIYLFAYRLGIESDALFEYWNHLRLPTFNEAEKISQELQDSEGRLLDAWAQDHRTLWNQQYPIDEKLPIGEQIVLNAVRFGFYRFYGGKIQELAKTNPKTLDLYLKSGKFPARSDHQKSFFIVLAKMIQGPLQEEAGLSFLRSHLGKKSAREYWYPKNLEEVSQLETKHIERYFEDLKNADGSLPTEIVCQFAPKPTGNFSSFTSYRKGEEKIGSQYGQIHIRRKSDGEYEIISASGYKSQEFVDHVRNLEEVKSGKITLRSDGWLGLKTFHIEDLKELRSSDIDGWFESLNISEGNESQEIVWQYGAGHQKSALASPQAFRFGEEKKGYYFGQIHFRRLGKGEYEIVAAKGIKAQEVISQLREIQKNSQRGISIRSDGWLGLRAFTLEDLNELKTSDIQDWYRDLKTDSTSPNEIVLQFSPKSQGTLGFPTVFKPGEENEGASHCHIKILRITEDLFEVLSARGLKAHEIIAQLRNLEFAQKKILIRSNGWLGLQPLRVEDLKDLRISDIESWFAYLKNSEGNIPHEMIWQFLPSRQDSLSSPTSYRLGEEKKSQDYGNIHIKRLQEGHYEIISSKGKGAKKVLEALKKSEMAQNKSFIFKL